MNSIFAISGLTFKTANLLFLLEKEMIESDIAFSKKYEDQKLYDGKDTWFFYWKKGIDTLFAQLMNISPNEKLDLKNIDKNILYNEVSQQISNIGTSWNEQILIRCLKFTPYIWKDLINNNIDPKAIIDLQNYQNFYLNLEINNDVRIQKLVEIGMFLRI